MLPARYNIVAKNESAGGAPVIFLALQDAGFVGVLLKCLKVLSASFDKKSPTTAEAT